jgi:hypothetical protein
MNSTQTNKLNMYLAVQSVLDSHKDTWQSLAGFAAGAGELNERIASIQSLAQTQTSKTGAAADKAQAYNALVDASFEVAAATRAWAVANSDNELAARVGYSRSELVRGRDIEIVARCQGVFTAANDNVESLGDYGVTRAKLTAFKKKIDGFQAAQVKPRHGRATSRAATKALPDLFEQVDELLNDRLDGLVVQFKDSEPAFYNEYDAARRIGSSTGGRSTSEDNSGNGASTNESSTVAAAEPAAVGN